eukprot:TRINITY_DN8079_c0_g1_i1.p1 TRINITY_DN8079_c0_g1~~TRINITY_DN8079_c0_g1_i1.p1  ORF type:complete len:198 (+),score=9.97 TRINITY_DN8079_c0_g1_i1:114-707(+)
MAENFNIKRSAFKCRRTQMRTIGLLNLKGSTSRTSRSLAARRVPEPTARRSAMPPSPPSTPPLCKHGPSPSYCSSSSDAGQDHGGANPLAATGTAGSSDESDEGCSLPRPETAVLRRRPGRQRRRNDGRSRIESVEERQAVLADLVSAALHRLLGPRARVDASVEGGMMAKMVGSADAASRLLFFVVGTHAVDLASL